MIALIAELFVWSFDLLAIAIAALLTSLLSHLLGITIDNRESSGLIFLWASIVALVIFRIFVLPSIQWKEETDPMSAHAVIWMNLQVQEVNNKHVVRYQGVYWNIDTEEKVVPWDIVAVEYMHDNHLVVKKM